MRERARAPGRRFGLRALRRCALTREARRLGLRAVPGPAPVPRWTPVSSTYGDRVYARDLVDGHWRGIEVSAFELRVRGKGLASTTACVVTRVPAHVPRISIDPIGASADVGSGVALLGGGVEGGRFDREYRVAAVDRDAALGLLDAGTVRWLVERARPRFHAVLEGAHVGCFLTLPSQPMPGSTLPELLEPMLRWVEVLAGRVRATAGARSAGSRPGRRPRP
jgi:hypothetical protein